MRAVWALVVCCGSVGCDRGTSECHERMTAAQAIVLKVDGKSAQSVEQSLAAVEEAYAICEKAKLGPEREQLLKAKNELSAQRDLLEARARRKKVAAPSKEELAKLAQTGDASCPRGQAYKPRESPREIRCTGPQIVEMNVDGLRSYYEDRRFKVTSPSPTELRAELGSELYVFGFEDARGGAPQCITAHSAPGMSWQEVTSRLTGVAPDKLKLDAAVKVGSRELPLAVEHPTDKPTVRLGECRPQ